MAFVKRGDNEPTWTLLTDAAVTAAFINAELEHDAAIKDLVDALPAKYAAAPDDVDRLVAFVDGKIRRLKRATYDAFDQWLAVRLVEREREWVKEVFGGAITARLRTLEGYTLANGDGRTCLPDAVANGARELGVPVSLARLRHLAIPQLGNVGEATWNSTRRALQALDSPLGLGELSFDCFRDVVRAPPAVYLVRIQVVVDGKADMHVVMASTLAKPGSPHGKIVDNYSKQKPVYFEDKDRASHKAALRAFEMALGTHSLGSNCRLSFAGAKVLEAK